MLVNQRQLSVTRVTRYGSSLVCAEACVIACHLKSSRVSSSVRCHTTHPHSLKGHGTVAHWHANGGGQKTPEPASQFKNANPTSDGRALLPPFSLPMCLRSRAFEGILRWNLKRLTILQNALTMNKVLFVHIGYCTLDEPINQNSFELHCVYCVIVNGYTCDICTRVVA